MFFFFFFFFFFLFFFFFFLNMSAYFITRRWQFTSIFDGKKYNQIGFSIFNISMVKYCRKWFQLGRPKIVNVKQCTKYKFLKSFSPVERVTSLLNVNWTQEQSVAEVGQNPQLKWRDNVWWKLPGRLRKNEPWKW